MIKLDDDAIVKFNSGTENVVFFIHPVGGQIHWYRRIVKVLKSFGHCPTMYGLIAPGLVDEKIITPLHVTEIAECYAKYILVKHKDLHDVVIVAWSFGCEIAFEMAKTLEKKAVTSPLILLDPQRMDNHRNNVTACITEVITKEYGLPKLLLDDLSGDVQELAAYIVEAIADNIQIESSLIPQYQKSVSVYISHLICMSHYKRIGSIARAHIFLAQTSGIGFTFMNQASLRDWSSNVVFLEQSTVAGDHYSILAEGSSVNIIANAVKSLVAEFEEHI